MRGPTDKEEEEARRIRRALRAARKFPTLDQARAQGEEAQEAVLAAADAEWAEAAVDWVKALPGGYTFIAEDVVMAVTKHGFTTRNAKAIGPIIARLGREGYIEKTGKSWPARTSHASLKPEWIRLRSVKLERSRRRA